MSLITFVVLLLAAIGEFLSSIVSGIGEVVSRLAVELPKATGNAVELREWPVIAFIVITGCLAIKHFRE